MHAGLLTVIAGDIDFFFLFRLELETDRKNDIGCIKANLGAKTKRKNVKWKKRRCFPRKFTLTFNSLLVTYIYWHHYFVQKFVNMVLSYSHCTCRIPLFLLIILFVSLFVAAKDYYPAQNTETKGKLFFMWVLKKNHGGGGKRLSKRSEKQLELPVRKEN